MAKIDIDASLCTGCGLCASTCPEVFEIGDDNVARVLSAKGTCSNIAEVAEQCPVSAISVK